MLFRKIFVVIFCTLMLFISSCGETNTSASISETAAGENEGSYTGDTPENIETEDARAAVKDSLPENIDLGGAVIRVLSR